VDTFALLIEGVFAVLTCAGIAYGVLALLAARSFERSGHRNARGAFAPGVSILKPLKGAEPHLYAAFASHCEQQYAGEFELLFGVRSLDDAAVADVARLRVEYPHATIRLIECPRELGSNGKISTLAQLLPEARFEHVIVNDSDIRVSSHYLRYVMLSFTNDSVGLVTAPYVGHAAETIPSRLEALGISTDFIAGVLVARMLERGIRFGLGSTLATRKAALEKIGGFEALANELADDYEMGARMAKAGLNVELMREVVSTTVPAYSWRGLCDHQLRWARSTRDSRRAGYFGLCVTYVLPWAMATVIASGFSLWSISLFSVALLTRVTVALTVGVGILRDGQVLRDMWLLPVRDCFGLLFWAWSYASDEVVWRGERFRLRRGRMEPIASSE
jgi:ceramide glucosyltransferase